MPADESAECNGCQFLALFSACSQKFVWCEKIFHDDVRWASFNVIEFSSHVVREKLSGSYFAYNET